MKNVKTFEDYHKIINGVKDFGKSMFSGDYDEFDTTTTVDLSKVESILQKAISSGEIDMISVSLEDLIKRINTSSSSGFDDFGAE